ncbi:Uncharacterised protein [Mycobacteroides abscessus subsp. abscessus]|nr:Uncharacterised protein [Mycobacteroides abscessus subsp. abscessus]
MRADDPLPDLDEALDPDPGRGVRAVRGGGADERRDVAGVVDLGVVVGHAAHERGRPPLQLNTSYIAMPMPM